MIRRVNSSHWAFSQRMHGQKTHIQYECIYIYIYAYIHICIDTYISQDIYIYIYIYLYISIYIYINSFCHLYMYLYISGRMKLKKKHILCQSTFFVGFFWADRSDRSDFSSAALLIQSFPNVNNPSRCHLEVMRRISKTCLGTFFACGIVCFVGRCPPCPPG